MSIQEERVLNLARQGFGDKQIAQQLELSTDTVRTYWQRIRRKVGAVTRAEIIATLGDKRTAAALEAAEDEKSALQREIDRRKKTEQALRASEREWRRLADSMPHMVFVAKADGQVIHHNARFYEYTGLTATEVDEEVSRRVIHPDDLDALERLAREHTAAGTGYETEARIRRHDGVYRWHIGRAVPYRDENQVVVRWYGTWTDVHESRLMRDQLMTTAASLQMAQEMASLGSYEYDIERKQSKWSRNLFALFEMPEEEDWFDSTEFFNMVHPDDKLAMVESFNRTLTEGAPFDLVYRVCLKSGHVVLVHSIGRPLIKDSRVVSLAGTIQDLTAREQAKDALALSEQRFKAVTDAYPLGVFVTDPEGSCIYTNPKYREIVGISDEEARGDGWFKVLHHEDRGKVHKCWQMVFARGEMLDQYYRVPRPDGEMASIHVRASEISIDGKSHGYVGVVEDATDRTAKSEVPASNSLKSAKI